MFDKKQIPAVTELYRHFDADGVLLYVGISNSSFNRYNGHRAKSPWLRLSVRMTIERFQSREEAEKAERKAIREEKPKYNKAHALTDSEKQQQALPMPPPPPSPPKPKEKPRYGHALLVDTATKEIKGFVTVDFELNRKRIDPVRSNGISITSGFDYNDDKWQPIPANEHWSVAP